MEPSITISDHLNHINVLASLRRDDSTGVRALMTKIRDLMLHQLSVPTLNWDKFSLNMFFLITRVGEGEGRVSAFLQCLPGPSCRYSTEAGFGPDYMSALHQIQDICNDFVVELRSQLQKEDGWLLRFVAVDSVEHIKWFS